MELMIAALFFLLLVYSSAATSPPPSVDNDTDHSPLLDFKNSITGDPTGILFSWNHTTHFCSWPGINCGLRLRVTVLDLSSRNLLGPLPPSLAYLTSLTTLNLSFNSLFGAIPANLSRCSALTVIDLNDNDLTGAIPAQLASLSNLDTLGLAHNHFTGQVPPWLGNLTALTRLSLASNSLVGPIPPQLGRLHHLQILILNNNNLSGTIPAGLFNLSSLQQLSISLNRLTGRLPPDIGDTLPNLQSLLLAGNRLTGPIPASITNATSLQVVDLPNNALIGHLPPDFGRLQGLHYLNLNLNQLTAGNDWRFFTSLTNCSGLQKLDIAANDLAGVLPASIANLSAELQQLQLQENQLSGTISPGIRNLVSLSGLAIHDNLLTGPIPDGIGELRNLQWLGLYGNRLAGGIPSSIGNLTQLNYLGLFSNNLQGPIPPSLGGLQQLNTLALFDNRLNGSIPKEIFSLPALSYVLNLANNSFVGSLPSEIGRLAKLEAFYVSSNQLTGEVPPEIGDCQSLEYLSLDNNLFNGAITKSLGRLKGLRDLDLSHNNFSGPIPESLGNLNAIELLDLSYNHLDGVVPMKGSFRNATAVSLLGNDRLCGGIEQLHLAGCSEITTERRERPHQLRIVIPVVGSVLCLLTLFYIAYIYQRRKPRKQNSVVSSIGNQFQKVSYTELAKATDGFAAANLIGKGQYGSVYRGILDNAGTSIVVAVKVFNLEQKGASKSFIAECDALRLIRHRNLIKILTTCSSIDSKGDDFKALVFEFMPNGSLDSWLHPEGTSHNQLSNLSLVQRLNLAIDVADALSYLHHDCDPPVVHCDLKPNNVLVDDDMRAHVGDFGIARILSEAITRSSQDSSSTIGIKGSIGYVPPEYGTGCQVSTSGDVYSYGILLMEMFTGLRPVDDMFKDSRSLHSFVEMAFPNRVMEIADPLMLLQEQHTTIAQSEVEAIQKCLHFVFKVGLSCANQSPRERNNMTDAANEIRKTREAYLRRCIQQEE